MRPVLLVIAGPNGSGKTTITARLRSERWSEGVEYVNPDEIARDRFGDWNDPAAVLAAARWAAARRAELLAAGTGLVDGRQAELCARTQDGQLRKIYTPYPGWVGDALAGVAFHPDFVDLRATG